jgi:hypothetical protein
MLDRSGREHLIITEFAQEKRPHFHVYKKKSTKTKKKDAHSLHVLWYYVRIHFVYCILGRGVRLRLRLRRTRNSQQLQRLAIATATATQHSFLFTHDLTWEQSHPTSQPHTLIIIHLPPPPPPFFLASSVRPPPISPFQERSSHLLPRVSWPHLLFIFWILSILGGRTPARIYGGVP